MKGWKRPILGTDVRVDDMSNEPLDIGSLAKNHLEQLGRRFSSKLAEALVIAAEVVQNTAMQKSESEIVQ